MLIPGGTGGTQAMSSEGRWWKHGVFYQVYPRSFQDSDGDGIGDLDGVAMRLDYLAWLGVDAIWLNPIHPSPNRDWGYDVANYLDVTPSSEDHCPRSADRRGISPANPGDPDSSRTTRAIGTRGSSMRSPVGAQHRDWYVWADPSPAGGPPNNWRSSFRGPAWTFDPSSGQYYLHNFLPQQPDLNWWNDDVRGEFDRIVRFWFDRALCS